MELKDSYKTEDAMEIKNNNIIKNNQREEKIDLEQLTTEILDLKDQKDAGKDLIREQQARKGSEYLISTLHKYPKGIPNSPHNTVLFVNGFTKNALKNIFVVSKTSLSIFSVTKDLISHLCTSEIPQTEGVTVNIWPVVKAYFNPSKHQLYFFTTEKDSLVFSIDPGSLRVTKIKNLSEISEFGSAALKTFIKVKSNRNCSGFEPYADLTNKTGKNQNLKIGRFKNNKTLLWMEVDKDLAGEVTKNLLEFRNGVSARDLPTNRLPTTSSRLIGAKMFDFDFLCRELVLVCKVWNFGLKITLFDFSRRLKLANRWIDLIELSGEPERLKEWVSDDFRRNLIGEENWEVRDPRAKLEIRNFNFLTRSKSLILNLRLGRLRFYLNLKNLFSDLKKGFSCKIECTKINRWLDPIKNGQRMITDRHIGSENSEYKGSLKSVCLMDGETLETTRLLSERLRGSRLGELNEIDQFGRNQYHFLTENRLLVICPLSAFILGFDETTGVVGEVVSEARFGLVGSSYSKMARIGEDVILVIDKNCFHFLKVQKDVDQRGDSMISGGEGQGESSDSQNFNEKIGKSEILDLQTIHFGDLFEDYSMNNALKEFALVDYRQKIDPDSEPYYQLIFKKIFRVSNTGPEDDRRRVVNKLVFLKIDPKTLKLIDYEKRGIIEDLGKLCIESIAKVTDTLLVLNSMFSGRKGAQNRLDNQKSVEEPLSGYRLILASNDLQTRHYVCRNSRLDSKSRPVIIRDSSSNLSEENVLVMTLGMKSVIFIHRVLNHRNSEKQKDRGGLEEEKEQFPRLELIKKIRFENLSKICWQPQSLSSTSYATNDQFIFVVLNKTRQKLVLVFGEKSQKQEEKVSQEKSTESLRRELFCLKKAYQFEEGESSNLLKSCFTFGEGIACFEVEEALEVEAEGAENSPNKFSKFVLYDFSNNSLMNSADFGGPVEKDSPKFDRTEANEAILYKLDTIGVREVRYRGPVSSKVFPDLDSDLNNY